MVIFNSKLVRSAQIQACAGAKLWRHALGLLEDMHREAVGCVCFFNVGWGVLCLVQYALAYWWLGSFDFFSVDEEYPRAI